MILWNELGGVGRGAWFVSFHAPKRPAFRHGIGEFCGSGGVEVIGAVTFALVANTRVLTPAPQQHHSLSRDQAPPGADHHVSVEQLVPVGTPGRWGRRQSGVNRGRDTARFGPGVDGPAGSVEEHESVPTIAMKREQPLVDHRMTPGAQRRQQIRLGLAAVDPPLDVVDLVGPGSRSSSTSRTDDA
jgi:hypothetical protein